MVRLIAYSQHARFTHGVAATRHVANLGRAQNQILVAHDFGHGRGDVRHNSPLQALQVGIGRRVIKNEFAELADRLALDGPKSLFIERLGDEAAHVVFVGIDQRPLHDFCQRKIGNLAFGRYPLTLRTSRQSR